MLLINVHHDGTEQHSVLYFTCVFLIMITFNCLFITGWSAPLCNDGNRQGPGEEGHADQAASSHV